MKGRNEEKVKFSADHLRKELDKLADASAAVSRKVSERVSGSGKLGLDTSRATPTHPLTHSLTHALRDLIIAGPAPAPLARAETYYRYQIMLRTRQMTSLSQRLAGLIQSLVLPEDISLTVDIDPVNLA